MNQMLTTVGAMAAVAKVASTAYYYAEHYGVFNREAKVEAETRSAEVAENQSADVGIPVFNGSGYEIWSSMMKTLFLSQDLWDMVDGGYIEEELTVEVLREVRKKDAVVLLFIQQAIDKSVFSCIAGASKSKEAWDALQKKYRGDAQEPNRQTFVDESVLSCPADATEFREASDALEIESQGYTDEPNQKKVVDELVLSYAADATDPKEAAWGAPQQGHKANTKVVKANRTGKEFRVFNSNCGFKEGCSANSNSGCGGGGDDRHFKMNHSDNSTPAAESDFHSKLKLSEDGIGKESGDVKNNNCGSKKGSRGISNRGGRGGRNCERLNNNQGGHGGRDGECSNNQGSHGGIDNGDFNNSQGGRGGQGRGHINNNRGGRGGKGRGHINNKQGCRLGKEDGCFNGNKGHRGGVDNGHFNEGSEAADYNSKNAKSELASSCTTNATETKEALDAHGLQQGHQANTEVHAQSPAGDSNGGVSQSLTTLLVGDLDVNVTDQQLLGIFIPFGKVVSSGVYRDMASHCSLGYGYVTYVNPQDADRALKLLDFTPLNGKPIRIMYPPEDSTNGAHFNNNQGGRVGTDGGCFNNKDSKLSGFNSKNPSFESVSSCSTNATESREASGAPQQGHQANTEVMKAREMTKSTKVHVGNLSESTTKEDLREAFGHFGTIANIVVVRDGDGKSKCYGFVHFKEADDASWCIQVLNGHKFDNKEWCVRRASQKKRARRAKSKSVDESVPSSTANASKSKKAGDAVSEKKIIGKSQKKSVDESVPSSTAKATESKTSGDEVSQKKFNGRAQKKSVEESVPSSTANETESKKAVEAVQKGCRANTRVLYVDNKGVVHFKLKSRSAQKSIIS